MSIEVLEIITVDDVREFSSNEKLVNLCVSESSKVSNYIKQLTAKIRTQIDKEQFKEWESYNIPNDLKLATVNLLDSFYSYSIVGRQNVGTGTRTSYSEKVDDYSITESYSQGSNALSWLWLPIDNETMLVFMSYMVGAKLWSINLH